MKSNKWNLITAILDLTASIFFVLAAVVQTENLSKALYGITAICLLIGGIGFFYTYAKNRKTSDND